MVRNRHAGLRHYTLQTHNDPRKVAFGQCPASVPALEGEKFSSHAGDSSAQTVAACSTRCRCYGPTPGTTPPPKSLGYALCEQPPPPRYGWQFPLKTPSHCSLRTVLNNLFARGGRIPDLPIHSSGSGWVPASTGWMNVTSAGVASQRTRPLIGSHQGGYEVLRV